MIIAIQILMLISFGFYAVSGVLVHMYKKKHNLMGAGFFAVAKDLVTNVSTSWIAALSILALMVSIASIVATVAIFLANIQPADSSDLIVHTDSLEVRGVSDKDLVVYNPAMQDIFAIFDQRGFNPDSLWFTVVYHPESHPPSLPPWIDPADIQEGAPAWAYDPHFVIYVSQSAVERDQFLYYQDHERRGTGIEGTYLTTMWDEVLVISKDRTQLLDSRP